MKSISIILLLSGSFLSHSQVTSLKTFFGPSTPAAFQKLGAVKGVAGIIGDNYYVLENDYGRRFDFSNNIETYVSCFSIKDCKLKKRFNLNEMLASTKKEMNKILFCDVIIWKDKIIGFYTYKNPSGKNFLASAIILDAEGGMLKNDISVGDFSHDYKEGSFLWQGGLLVNGRNTLSVVKDFQYRFTPDMSKMVVLCATPENANGNIHFKIYDAGMNEQKDIIAQIPLQEKVSDLRDFAIDDGGYIYVLTKTYKSKSERKKISNDEDYYEELHCINPTENNKVKTLAITVAGKTINSAELALNSDNEVYCAGTYWDPANSKSKNNTKGVFSLHVNKESMSVSQASQLSLPDSVIRWLNSNNKKLADENGALGTYSMYQVIPDREGGLYIVLAHQFEQVEVRGSTGALNRYIEWTYGMVIMCIKKDKKIKWVQGIRPMASNGALLTRIYRPLFFIKDHALNYLDAWQEFKLFSFDYDKGSHSGKYMDKLDASINGGGLVERSMLPLGNNEYIMTGVKENVGIVKHIGIVRVTFE